MIAGAKCVHCWPLAISYIRRRWNVNYCRRSAATDPEVRGPWFMSSTQLIYIAFTFRTGETTSPLGCLKVY
ncbi:hypothetical protein NMG60_11029905 [Bertholletia excelsa]